MFQAHQTRTFRAVTFVSRMLGRERKPHLDGVRSTLYPLLDLSLPYWVATDHKVWATSEDEADLIEFAKRLTRMLYPGERVFVTHDSVVIWSGRGQQSVVCDDCGAPDEYHRDDVEH